MTVVIAPPVKRKVPIYSVNTLAEYINRIGLIKIKKHLYFRGFTNQDYDLSPSLDRFIENSKEKWIAKESRLVEFAEQRFPKLFEKVTPSLLISGMQHYGIPTRMLDVTGNALVALYFSCIKDEYEGQVIIFDEHPLSAFNPFVNIIADTYRLTNNSIMSVDEYRYKIYHQEYASSLVYKNWEDDQKDTMLSLINKPLLVDVGALNQRQINQDGKFIILPNRIVDNNIINEIVKIDKSSDFISAIINISKDGKKKILEQLELVGINEGFIYPDDVGKVNEGIKRTIMNELLTNSK